MSEPLYAVRYDLEYGSDNFRFLGVDDKILAFTPDFVVYQNFELDIAILDNLLPKPFVAVYILHRNALIPVKPVYPPASDKKGVAPSSIVFDNNPCKFGDGVGLFLRSFGSKPTRFGIFFGHKHLSL